MTIAPLLKKELKELFNEKTILLGVILMPLILFPLLGVVLSTSTETRRDASETLILVVNLDSGKYGNVFVEALKYIGFRTVVEQEPVSELSRHLQKVGGEAAVVIPSDFTQALVEKRPPTVKTYVKLASSSVVQFERASQIHGMVYSGLLMVGERLAADAGVDFSFYREPVKLSGEIIYRDTVYSFEDAQTLFQRFLSMTLFIPLILVLVVTTSGTVAATSIGLEKEAKTLEMLLTLPIGRSSILFSKLLGSSVIAILGTASMIVGLTFYLSGLSSVSGMEMQFQVSPVAVMVLAPILFLAMVTTLSIGVLAGVLAGDVRGGQQIAALMQMPLILLPLLVSFTADFSTVPEPLSTILNINPFTHMILAVQSVIEENYASVVLHLGVMAAFTVFLLIIAAWLFRGERLLTTKIQLRRQRATS